VLAVIRPDDWNIPLLLHVVGAMILVGSTLAAASVLAFARGDHRLLRLGYFTLLAVGLPSYALMWGAAHWIYAKEGLDEGAIEFTWVAIGFAVTEVGAVLFLTALILGGIGVRRLPEGRGDGFLRSTTIICLTLLAGFLVAAWAMTAKPD
jgi:hypothetical protein